MKNKALILIILIMLLHALPKTALANNALIMRGVARTFISLFEIPKTMIAHSQNVMFPIGVATGAVEGTIRTAWGTLGGALDIAQGAAPYAKYLLFL